MVRYFLAILLFIISCSFIGQVTGDVSQKNIVDKVTLDDFDLSAKNGTQEDDPQENLDPLDFIVSTYQIHLHFKVLDDYRAYKQSFFSANKRYSIKTRAPPLLASA